MCTTSLNPLTDAELQAAFFHLELGGLEHWDSHPRSLWGGAEAGRYWSWIHILWVSSCDGVGDAGADTWLTSQGAQVTWPRSNARCQPQSLCHLRRANLSADRETLSTNQWGYIVSHSFTQSSQRQGAGSCCKSQRYLDNAGTETLISGSVQKVFPDRQKYCSVVYFLFQLHLFLLSASDVSLLSISYPKHIPSQYTNSFTLLRFLTYFVFFFIFTKR